MRALVKTGETWKPVVLPFDIIPWLQEHDGQEAVVVDDDTKTYYCSRPEERDEYLKKKKKALMFYDLAIKIHGELKPKQDELF
jgi:hypothetical protein